MDHILAGLGSMFAVSPIVIVIGYIIYKAVIRTFLYLLFLPAVVLAIWHFWNPVIKPWIEGTVQTLSGLEWTLPTL